MIGCKPEKNRTLSVVRLCLEAQNETSLLFNKRNIYLQKIVDARKSDNHILDKSNLAEIDILNIQINEELNNFLNELKLEKEKFPDDALLDGMINHLESIRNFEKEFGTYCILIGDSIIDNEIEIAETITKLALGLKSETRKLKSTKAAFYEKHNITQIEIDSILDIIEK